MKETKKEVEEMLRKKGWELPSKVVQVYREVLRLYGKRIKERVEKGDLISGVESYEVTDRKRKLIQRFELKNAVVVLEKEEIRGVSNPDLFSVNAKLIVDDEVIASISATGGRVFDEIGEIIPSSDVCWALIWYNEENGSYKLEYMPERKEFQKKLQQLTKSKASEMFELSEVEGIEKLIKEAISLKVSVLPCVAPDGRKSYLFLF